MNMKGSIRQKVARRRSRRTGSTLVLVVIMTAALSVVAASLLKLGGTERRLNKSNILHTKAQNAAEAMVDYGFAELKTRWRRQTSFPMNALRSEPLVIPPTTKSFFSGDGLIYDELQLVGGNVPPGEWRYIDPNDPSNLNDPQKGKLVFSRAVDIFGKAVVADPTLGRREAYCRQTLLVRDAPLFLHAVFYNMDLEFHPGPKMDMQGPVHSNGDIFVQAINRLRFHSTLNAAGDIIYGFKPNDGQITQTGNVFVKNADGNWTNFHKGGDKRNPSNYYDSRMGDDWREDATERWGGNVATVDHGVPKMNPVGIDDYIPDDPATGSNEKYNPAYALIEPLVPESHGNYKGADVREQQFAYKAGLVFKVDKVADPNAPGGYGYELNAYKYNRKRQTDPKSEPQLQDGLPKMQDLKLDKVEQKLGKPLLRVNRYAEDNRGDPTGGFYDRRQQVGMDVIEMDVGLLAEMINEGEERGGNEDPWNGQYKLNPGAAVDWNGIVYVELPYDESHSGREDKVMPAARNVALRLNNAKNVPNPDFSKKSGYDEGFTLATNGQLYVKGHFNSDGESSTGSSTETDDGKAEGSSEAAAALYADAITILSNNFDDSKTKKDPNQREATYTEVSAALVTGLLPAVPGGTARSGGAHNLPRFLEDWDGVEFRYRGSLVALYESEAGIEPMNSGHSKWYKPPERNWGYNELFGAGIYPPGTPNTRDFRRTDFQFINEEEYLAALNDVDGYSASSSSHGHGSSFCNQTSDEDSGNNGGENGGGNNGNGNNNGNNGHGNDADGNDNSNPGNSNDPDDDTDDDGTPGNSGNNGNNGNNGNGRGRDR
jgi:hypothetical protein